MSNNALCFSAAEILLPDPSKIDPSRWAVVACDQYTSEPAYWEETARIVGDAPSMLPLILPEVYLSESAERIPAINRAMEIALREHLIAHPNAMIYLERTQSDGTVRHGVLGAVDLEAYDYKKGATTPIRATEGTVLERIPPRVAIRRDAPLEAPHIMLLIDDREKSVIEPLCTALSDSAPVYDFDLMQNGGHVRGFLLNDALQSNVLDALSALGTPDAMKARYGADLAPLLFAVGDGNHSLATAKATYEELKKVIGEEAALSHPARYALAEVVNIHDDALQFEPIYRVVFGVDPAVVLSELTDYVASLHGSAAPQSVTYVSADKEGVLTIPSPAQQLTVGTLQSFLSDFSARHPEAEVDYIHGEDSLRALAQKPNAIGFLFDGMRKDELFSAVIFDGALPRKTFSMGHAADKRYYLECRRIK